MKAIEKTYNEERVIEIRKRYHKLYLEYRAQLSDETPLIYSDLTNEYLNYRKSALAIYTMSEMLGEETLNKALIQFEKRYNNAEPPFATSLNFVEHIRSVTPDSIEYLVHDLFETITLYDNELLSVEQVESNNEFAINVNFNVTKYRANKNGKRTHGTEPISVDDLQSLPLNDYIDLGLYDKELNLIMSKRILVTEIHNQVSLVSDKRVYQVMIDSDYLLFDVNRDNDEWTEEN